ncbi:MAG: helix-turn-helix transcriptional regulator [Marinicaulis sp.]|nr:helix-turn-helix transcriptional regulator [Marinicaulis sp.]
MSKPGVSVKSKSKTSAPKKRTGPHPVDVHVGARLRLRRSFLDMSQEALGRALGLTFQQIQKYEKGSNRIGASRLYELSKLLEVPVQFFYDGYGEIIGGSAGHSENADVDPFMELINSPEGIELCRHYSAIQDPNLKKKVLELVRTIAQSDDLINR